MDEKDCLFCKIIKGDIPSKKVYEDEDIYAFHDINPQAPTHILVCPKRHIERVAEMTENDLELMGKVIYRAKEIAKDLKRWDFRLVINNGKEAGQEVFHIHVHLLGGRKFTWPPG
jgi:histidine triad (HIT) family protein